MDSLLVAHLTTERTEIARILVWFFDHDSPLYMINGSETTVNDVHDTLREHVNAHGADSLYWTVNGERIPTGDVGNGFAWLRFDPDYVW